MNRQKESTITNIKTEDELLSNLELLKSENKYEECIALIEQQLPSLERKLLERTRKILPISLRNHRHLQFKSL